MVTKEIPRGFPGPEEVAALREAKETLLAYLTGESSDAYDAFQAIDRLDRLAPYEVGRFQAALRALESPVEADEDALDLAGALLESGAGMEQDAALSGTTVSSRRAAMLVDVLRETAARNADWLAFSRLLSGRKDCLLARCGKEWWLVARKKQAGRPPLQLLDKKCPRVGNVVGAWRIASVQFRDVASPLPPWIEFRTEVPEAGIQLSITVGVEHDRPRDIDIWTCECHLDRGDAESLSVALATAGGAITGARALRGDRPVRFTIPHPPRDPVELRLCWRTASGDAREARLEAPAVEVGEEGLRDGEIE